MKLEEERGWGEARRAGTVREGLGRQEGEGRCAEEREGEEELSSPFDPGSGCSGVSQGRPAQLPALLVP